MRAFYLNLVLEVSSWYHCLHPSMSEVKQKSIAEGCAGTQDQEKRGESERKEKGWRRGRGKKGRRKEEEGECRK